MSTDSKRLEKIINDTIQQDLKTLAAMEVLATKIKTASAKKLPVDPKVHATIAAVTKNIEARQKQIRDNEKKVGFATKLASVPKALKEYISNVLNKTSNWFSSLWGVDDNDLGAEPISTGTVALIIGVSVIGSAIITAALFKLFEGSYKGAGVDFTKVANANKIFDAALAAGTTPAEIEAFKKDIDKQIQDAYKRGKSESSWGWMKNIGLIGGTLVLLTVGVPLIRTELNRYQAKRAA
jgi:hypothetical protein